MIADSDPLIVSLRFDAETFARVDDMRRAHFPPDRNIISAHLTLFHKLPGERVSDVRGALKQVADETPVFDVRFSGVRHLGRGVALGVEALALIAVRARLASIFADDLSPQDRQGFRPHATIQNKVTPEVSRDLYDQMAEGFRPWSGKATALMLWYYRGGPWEAVAALPFRSRED